MKHGVENEGYSVFNGLRKVNNLERRADSSEKQDGGDESIERDHRSNESFFLHATIHLYKRS